MPRIPNNKRVCKQFVDKLKDVEKFSKATNYDLKPLKLSFYKFAEGSYYLEQGHSKYEFYDEIVDVIRQRLELSAKDYGWVGVCSSNVGILNNMLLISKLVNKHEILGSWEHEIYSSAGYDSYLNPKIDEVGDEVEIDKELSLSSPGFLCHIKRYEEIKVSYHDNQMKEHTRDMFGWEARVFQHFLDQLKGKNILDWRINHGNFEILKEYKHELRKSNRAKTKLLEECTYFFEEYNELTATRSVEQLNQNDKYIYSDQLDKDYADFDKDLSSNFFDGLKKDWQDLLKKHGN